MKPLNKYIDHTALKPSVTSDDIEKLCAEAREYDFASVCIQPCHIPLAKELLRGSDVKVCTVIGFPLGANATAVKAFEVAQAYAAGCDEFDMVINVGALIEGKDEYVASDIAAVVGAAKGKCVKVIIETGLLTDEQKVRAVKLACASGANFVKTCTGFSGGAATPEDIRLMKANVAPGVQVKASGGIKTRASALALIEAGADRIGASSGVAIMHTEL